MDLKRRPSPHRLALTGGAALAVLTGAFATLAPSAAHACGGTFCDAAPAGPTIMPVDQTGENILFEVRDGRVEAQVQIEYMGDPEKFAWIVPVMAVPDVGVGSQQLMTNIVGSTTPVYTVNNVGLGCGTSDSVGCSADDSALSDFGGTFNGEGAGDDGDGGDSMDPDVVKRGQAGAFEYVVLEGGSIDGLIQWLDDNGYAQDDDAPPILEEYLDEGFVFLALKMRSGAASDEIHPVSISYEGTEPCIPIRLTRIAAIEDMSIRAYFLGDDRVVSSNYAHVEINELYLDWLFNLASNYTEVVTRAVDEADGHGFVTEYAGDIDIVPTGGLVDPAWDPSAFEGIAPTAVMDEIQAQNLGRCDVNGCTWNHPQTRPLLNRYLPVPDGVTEEDFYACLECYEAEIDVVQWSADLFAQEVDERIVAPGEHAQALLSRNDYLTRLFTTISPHEMTEDPLFVENPDLMDVDNQHAVDRKFPCEGPDWLEFENGWYLALERVDGTNRQPGDGTDGDFEDVPYALKIEMGTPKGPMMEVTDNTKTISKKLRKWNDDHPITVDDVDDLPPALRDEVTGCRVVPNGAAYMLGLLGLVFAFRRPLRRRQA